MLALADVQRAVATIAVFIATFLVTLSIGRLLKRRAGVPFGIFFQLFALTLPFYAAASIGAPRHDNCRHDRPMTSTAPPRGARKVRSQGSTYYVIGEEDSVLPDAINEG